METCQSPRKVFVLAWRVGQSCLPQYASKFSRKDFTLPQLFACLTLRQFYNLSYRKTEALLRDSPAWRRAIGLKKTPDHNTLSDAFDVVIRLEPAMRRRAPPPVAALPAAGHSTKADQSVNDVSERMSTLAPV